MRILNLGILAHVDAGKTSLTERLLHAAGVIDEPGRVDQGNTQTDSLALERQRGITIKSAVVSFAVGGTTVNLIDTPGHPDFIAEVERVLSVLDGAVLVVSAVEGVQPQTRVLMRTLRRLGIPTLIFINKIDRRGADPGRVLGDLAEKLSPAVVSMGSAPGHGTAEASFTPFGDEPGFAGRLLDVLADQSEALLAAYVHDEGSVSYTRLRAELAAQTGQARAHPVFSGSAITGAGVDALIAGIEELLPAAEGDPEGPLSGTVFKVERGPAGEKIAYVRMFSGTIRTRDRLSFAREGEFGASREGKVTAISVFDRGTAAQGPEVGAGRIARLWGLADVRIGDTIGLPRKTEVQGHFAPPTLETVVSPLRPGDRGALHLALAQLAEQDPLIGLRQDDVRQEVSVSLYGEVQKEVIQATLLDDYGIDVTFRETTTICVERPVGTGAAVELIGKDPNPFLATVGLRVERGPRDSGVEFRREVELGSLPYAFMRTIEETVHETLREGLHGWQVVDCVVTLTHTGYYARQSHMGGGFDKSMSSTAGDFRNLTPLVLMSALAQAGTTVEEPIHGFRIDLPPDTAGQVLPVLARLGGMPRAQFPGLLAGDIPSAGVHALEQQLPGLTRGEGALECDFLGHRPVRGPAPDRPRTDHNPLNRKEYLLRVVRRV
ncbi:TetM/TetW/TetO/TetS family tetracycline resistance ribosomal protection protein [Nonomuraea sp. KC401]|uniref:elongation factor G n=1 Tax=unclassified Nonomuraea TaxID=2593643 RepID=UPI0010FEA028|nr:TetM/TetW/TetO/TetS family tetracycline resistance ribosomal protection protein [Nonomuraea sp. KC401]NBE96200.1 GTP-binding protein [Nonomuraea sp. K271]TLF71103.1 TetM/TetW/TetO/TetS family tetracycline resistance ribosomal protection protein [Nonomuraea sp. KC401]